MSLPTLHQLTQALREGRTDPVSLLEEALSKSHLSENIWVTLLPELALEQARASQLRWRNNQPLSPLDGIPIAWKDVFDIAGTVTTCGSQSRSQVPAARKNAELVERLQNLGMVSLGKTTMSELAYSGLGINAYSGTPHNPYSKDHAHIPGGSSSGSAAAVAAGIVASSMGSDTSGSSRIPAACYGLVGYKPSSARYPKAGMFPLAPSLDTAGPIARNMADIRLLDACLTGLQPSVNDTPCLPYRPSFVVPEGPFLAQVDQAVRAVFEQLINRLSAAGYTIERRNFSPYTKTLALFKQHGTLVAIESVQVHQQLLNTPSLQAQVDPRIISRLKRGLLISPASAQQIRAQRPELIASCHNALAEHEILLYPTIPISVPTQAPLEADETVFAECNATVLSHTMPSSYLDMPSLSLPAGFDRHGLPVGISLTMSNGQDLALLAAAQSLEPVITPLTN
ncbi:amidase family protein [Alcaligenes endophyticus]|uniref:Amidase n=1 Tax=Alcaligenes endophyticus TaxID=1929088 RepID=A0ABT8EG49_9BURK|nr:amidase family protein [Alcaligenes endophyticus]MCX5590170.1 amidase family protein [Alcaligenes endophyticus]MDN4120167.1 amidase [Alcaligenes endophyticus]